MSFGLQTIGSNNSVHIGGTTRLGRVVCDYSVAANGSLNVTVDGFSSSKGRLIIMRQGDFVVGVSTAGTLTWTESSKNLKFSGSNLPVRILGFMFS